MQWTGTTERTFTTVFYRHGYFVVFYIFCYGPVVQWVQRASLSGWDLCHSTGRGRNIGGTHGPWYPEDRLHPSDRLENELGRGESSSNYDEKHECSVDEKSTLVKVMKGLMWSCTLPWRHHEHHGVSSPASRLFAHPFVQAQIKENFKAPHHWPLWGGSTGDRWIPLTKGQ